MTGYFATPVGMLGIADNGNAITSLFFAGDEQTETALSPLAVQAKAQLKEYFMKKRTTFDLPLEPKGTNFQRQVWQALTQIPYGETRTYQQIALTAGNEKACRAVGMANHVNPIAIIIPCHRVVGKNGTLTGYAGGLDTKRLLLDLETGDI